MLRARLDEVTRDVEECQQEAEAADQSSRSLRHDLASAASRLATAQEELRVSAEGGGERAAELEASVAECAALSAKVAL